MWLGVVITVVTSSSNINLSCSKIKFHTFTCAFHIQRQTVLYMHTHINTLIDTIKTLCKALNDMNKVIYYHTERERKRERYMRRQLLHVLLQKCQCVTKQ